MGRLTRPALLALALIAFNALLCRELFHSEFTVQMSSIEGSYMAISRWIENNPGDLTWFPLWFTGMPFHRVYQPGFHALVAGLAGALGWSIPRAYHFLCGVAYCCSPAALFVLCWGVTKRRGFAFVSGLIYSLISPGCLLVRSIRYDTGHLITARRFYNLVHYGEGPHVAALALTPVAILLLDRAVVARRWWAILLTPIVFAAIVVTNWPGAMGLALAGPRTSSRGSAVSTGRRWPALFSSPTRWRVRGSRRRPCSQRC